MDKIKIIEGRLVARDMRIGIVAARFNEFIVDQLLKGALDALKRHGANPRDLTVVRVPGAWEMPLVVKRMAAGRRYDGILGLGTVIRGATPHFDYVAGECAKGLGQASMQHDVPVAFGVLTTDTIEQAVERAGTKAGNKGADAAVSLVETIDRLRLLECGVGAGMRRRGGGGPRRQARRRAMQALYQWQITGQAGQDVYLQFAGEDAHARVDQELFRELVRNVTDESEDLDAAIGELSDRAVAQLDPVEHAILLIGIYELKHRAEVPYRVVISEAVELTRQFGAADGHKFVNALLDRAARRLRPTETAPPPEA